MPPCSRWCRCIRARGECPVLRLSHWEDSQSHAVQIRPGRLPARRLGVRLRVFRAVGEHAIHARAVLSRCRRNLDSSPAGGEILRQAPGRLERRTMHAAMVNDTSVSELCSELGTSPSQPDGLLRHVLAQRPRKPRRSSAARCCRIARYAPECTRLTTGVSASRNSPHFDAVPWGSRSISTVARPAFSAAAAMAQASVVFPVPPFWLRNAEGQHRPDASTLAS